MHLNNLYKKLLSLYLFLIGVVVVHAQEFKLKIEADQFEIDRLGNFYFVSQVDVAKYNSDFSEDFQFSFSNRGEISSVDVQQPFRIVVFSKETQSIGLLDNTLSLQNELISLWKRDFSRYSLITSSNYQNRFWGYDESNSQLVLWDENFQEVFRSDYLFNIQPGEWNPCQLIEKNGQLIVVDSSLGILVFDLFGSLKRNLSIFGILEVSFDGQMVLLRNGNKISIYNQQFLLQSEFTLPFGSKTIKSVRSVDQNYWILSSDSLYQYKK